MATASGILLAVAACIAGTDPELADNLPDTQGMRNRVVIGRHQRGTEADPAIRAAGGKIVDIGTATHGARVDEYLAAINEQTAAILLVAFEGETALDAIVKGAHERSVPVLVDGACAVPPIRNLWHYTRDLDVDAFITSGGKAIRGPQSTGLVLGKRAIIEGCKFHASPNLRLGRGMKVGKEEFAGIYTALKLFLTTDFEAQAAREKTQIARMVGILEGVPNLALSVVEGTQLQIGFDPAVFGITADAAAKTLLDSDPSILLRGRDNKITVRANLLRENEESVVAERLRTFFLQHLESKR